MAWVGRGIGHLERAVGGRAEGLKTDLCLHWLARSNQNGTGSAIR